MVVAPPKLPAQDIFYPSSDGEPLAETSVHVDAIIHTVVTLRQYLANQRAIVLADQFLYYAQGFPRLRVAPDVMVIFEVEPGPRDNYKTWEEESVPSVIFEITSKATQQQDQGAKKDLYENMGVLEYWLFDPKGEWIPEQLKGYCLRADAYQDITDGRSQVLGLRLEIDQQVIAFYRESTSEKLLAPDDLLIALKAETEAREHADALVQQEHQRAEQERQRADAAEQEVERLKAKLRELGQDA